jgi:Zn-dependent protease/CBS domain-containing protein
MARPLRVATIFGIPIKVDASWVFIVILLTTSFGLLFSRDFPHLGWPIWVLMGLASSLLLFGSVLAHELSHAVVALRHRIPIRGITLFIFGGAAELGDEPPNASAELKVALAGPAMSLALAVFFAGIYSFGSGTVPSPILGIVFHLARMNGILAVFNIIPGFPLDGGRILRALLWGIWGDLRTATRTASALGSGFGSLIIFLGLLYVFPFNNLIGGVWFVFIGLFLRSAARASYQQMLIRDCLKGVKVGDIMDFHVVTVPASARLEDIVHRVMLTSGLTEFPVVEGSRLLGMVGLREIRNVDRAMWGRVTAGEVMQSDVARNTVTSADEASRLLSKMAGDEAMIAVVDEGNLVGVVKPGDLMKRIRLRMELRGS